MDSSQNKKIAKGYIRVSTHIQDEDGVSMETQAKRIHDYCNYKNYNLVKIYEDAGISGKDVEHRPGIQELLRDLQKDEYIIYCDFARMSRDARESLNIFYLIEQKKAFHVCLEFDMDTSTSIGKMVAGIICNLNQMNRENSAKLISVNMQRLSSEGKLRSRCPFGYKFVGKDKDYEIVQEQLEVAKMIVTLYKSGTSIHGITGILNTNGYAPTLNLNKKKQLPNPQFTSMTVKRILADQGLIQMENRKPVDQRIKSFHKPT